MYDVTTFVLNSMQRENRYFCISLSTIGLCQSIENWMRIHACTDEGKMDGFLRQYRKESHCVTSWRKEIRITLTINTKQVSLHPRPTKMPRIEPLSQWRLDNEKYHEKTNHVGIFSITSCRRVESIDLV